MDKNYQQWRRAAELSGLGKWASMEYYGEDNPNMYSAEINGSEFTFPILTTEAWLSPQKGVNNDFFSFSNEKESNVNHMSLQNIADRHGYIEGHANPEINNYCWNGDVYRPVAANPDGLEFKFELSDYYTTTASIDQLGEELHRALYNADLSAKATSSQIREVIESTSLMVRDQKASSLREILDLKRFYRKSGAIATLVLNTGSGYEVLYTNRAEDLIENPSQIGTLPGGCFQPEPQNGHPLEVHIMKEFSEELFGTEMSPEPPLKHEGVVRLQECLERGTAHIDFTGALIETVKTHMMFNMLIFIDDPAYTDWLKNNLTGSYETIGIEVADLGTRSDVSKLTDVREVAPGSGVAFIENLLWLQDEYDVDVAADIERKKP